MALQNSDSPLADKSIACVTGTNPASLSLTNKYGSYLIAFCSAFVILETTKKRHSLGNAHRGTHMGRHITEHCAAVGTLLLWHP